MEGQNIGIVFRWADGQYDRLPGLAAELVRLKVSIIVAGVPAAIQAAKQATETKEILPRISRVALIGNPANPAYTPWVRGVQDSARALGVHILEARDPRGIGSLHGDHH